MKTMVLEKISYDDKPVLQQLLELYIYELTQYQPKDINAHGYCGYPYTDCYWLEKGRHPYFVKVEGALAGFVLVRGEGEYIAAGKGHSMAEFFVLHHYRNQGIGYGAAEKAFALHPGLWEVLQLPKNKPAQAFWKKVITKYKGQNCKEVGSVQEKYVGFLFTTPI